MKQELTHADAINFTIEFFSKIGKNLQPNMKACLMDDWTKHVTSHEQASSSESSIAESNDSVKDSGFEGFSHGSE